MMYSCAEELAHLALALHHVVLSHGQVPEPSLTWGIGSSGAPDGGVSSSTPSAVRPPRSRTCALSLGECRDVLPELLMAGYLVMALSMVYQFGKVGVPRASMLVSQPEGVVQLFPSFCILVSPFSSHSPLTTVPMLLSSHRMRRESSTPIGLTCWRICRRGWTG